MNEHWSHSHVLYLFNVYINQYFCSHVIFWVKWIWTRYCFWSWDVYSLHDITIWFFLACGCHYSGNCSDVQWSASQNFSAPDVDPQLVPVITNLIHSYSHLLPQGWEHLVSCYCYTFKLKRISILTSCIAKYSIWKFSFHNSLSCIFYGLFVLKTMFAHCSITDAPF